MKSEEVEPTMKIFWNRSWKGIWPMKFILTSNFEKDSRITPGNLDESGKILGKTCGLGPTKKKHRWEGLLNEKWCTGAIERFEWGDNLEIIECKHESSEMSSALRKDKMARGEWSEGNIWAEGKNTIDNEKLELDPLKKEMRRTKIN